MGRSNMIQCPELAQGKAVLIQSALVPVCDLDDQAIEIIGWIGQGAVETVKKRYRGKPGSPVFDIRWGGMENPDLWTYREGSL